MEKSKKFYALYVNAKNLGMQGENYPIVISTNTSILKKNKKSHLFLEEINNLPDLENICAKGDWYKVPTSENTFVFTDDSSFDLIAYEELSNLLPKAQS